MLPEEEIIKLKSLPKVSRNSCLLMDLQDDENSGARCLSKSFSALMFKRCDLN